MNIKWECYVLQVELSVDTDHIAPIGAVWSGSTLLSQAYLSENLGLLL